MTGDIFPPGGPVILEGNATDLEDGPITDGLRFRWSSSLEGELGVGQKLFFEDLLPGRHVITLEVMDSDLYVDRVSVTIYVGYRTYLPIISR